MKTSTRRLLFWGLLASAVSIPFTGPSRAFDSTTRAKMHTQGLPSPPAPFPMTAAPFFTAAGVVDEFNDGSTPNDGHIRYDVRTLHHAFNGAALSQDPTTGGYAQSKDADGNKLFVTGAGSNFIQGLYSCPRGPVLANTQLLNDACKPIQAAETEVSPWGWVNIRKAWDSDYRSDGYRPEHKLITEYAGSLVGFDTTQGSPALSSTPSPLGSSSNFLTQTVWMRYPTKNRYVVSPITPDDPSKQNTSDLIVGASFVPPGDESTNSGLPGAGRGLRSASTHAMRAFRLSDLSAMPDSATTVWDWVAGGEICPPTANPNSAFDGIPVSSSGADINACHDFGRGLGALNVSHFAPLNRQMYEYYHDLAMQRMTECVSLAKLIHPFYEYWDWMSPKAGPEASSTPFYRRPFERTSQLNNTEAHECEREAFVFEMFAVHFLEDAWSTGHMWNRWGIFAV